MGIANLDIDSEAGLLGRAETLRRINHAILLNFYQLLTQLVNNPAESGPKAGTF